MRWRSLPPLLTALLATAPARAEEESQLTRGQVAFQAGDYVEALGAFESAYLETDDAEALLMLGRCHEALSETASARRRYQQLLGREDLTPALREVAERLLASLGGAPPPSGDEAPILFSPVVEAPEEAPILFPPPSTSVEPEEPEIPFAPPSAPAPPQRASPEPAIAFRPPDGGSTEAPPPIAPTDVAEESPAQEERGAEPRAFPLSGLIYTSMIVPLDHTYDGDVPVGPAADLGLSVLLGSYVTLELTLGIMGCELGPNTEYAWMFYTSASLGVRVFPFDDGGARARGSHSGIGPYVSPYLGLSLGGGYFWESGGRPQHREDATAQRAFENIDDGRTRGGNAHALFVIGVEGHFGGRLGLRLEARTYWSPFVTFADARLFAPAEPAWIESIAAGFFF